MKFTVARRKTWKEIHEAKSQWHKVFVIWPRKVSDTEYRFLEYVYRKGKYYSGYADSFWEYEYISIEQYERMQNA